MGPVGRMRWGEGQGRRVDVELMTPWDCSEENFSEKSWFAENLERVECKACVEGVETEWIWSERRTDAED